MRPRELFAGRASVPGSTHRLVMVVVCALLGCDATDPADLPAEQQFMVRAWPALARCVGCHGTQPAISFLAPGTAQGAYATIFSFQPPIVDVESPASSLLVTMGKHTGPPLVAGETDAILSWLDAERAVRIPDSGHPVAVGPVDLVLGALNAVDLGLGATLRFVPAPAAAGLSLSRLELVAGNGYVHVVHPLFASHPRVGPPRIDTIDAFGDIDLDLPAHAVEPLGGGSALFTGFAPSDPITIHFRKLEAP